MNVSESGAVGVFQKTLGAHLTKEQVARYGPRIHWLAWQHGGQLTAEIILEDAIRPDSPLHDYFEWDDEAAAHLYRLSQARYLYRSILMTTHVENVESPDGADITIRLMVNAGRDTESPHNFRLIVADGAVQDAEVFEAVVAEKVRQAKAFANQVRQYKKFATVVHAIDAL